MALLQNKLAVTLILLQIAFVVLFALVVRYDDDANAAREKNSRDHSKGGADPHNNSITRYYAMFQDVHVMIFIGFGFLMTFLKRYGFSSVSYNLLLSAVAIQWAVLVGGFVHSPGGSIKVGITTLLTADFAAAAVLISFGAVLGKTSALQLVIMTVIEVVAFQLNEFLGTNVFGAVDVGGSMFVHVFGAYFGLTVATILSRDGTEKAAGKEGSVYHSDLFSVVGTLFLWVFWPSFNAALAPGDDQHRAVINTYFSLAACVVTTVAMSVMLNKNSKLDMVHIQNATLAGGVAVGTAADMMIQPWGALVVGSLAGVLSVVGFNYVTPWLSSKLKVHDTCGVNNLHGMPGIMAAIVGMFAALMASESQYGYSLYQIFPARSPVVNSTALFAVQKHLSVDPGVGRTAVLQAGFQLTTLCCTLLVAVVSGIVTGKLMQLSLWDEPKDHQLFDDSDYWLLPDEGFPEGKMVNEIVDGIHIDSITDNVENTNNVDIDAAKV
ncbi:hypothetical protein NP493_476g04051 [Ridgeia piscesae]|uniref:Ammonium transporter AmtB-like domain-containing protein n=1 Tax=Ridgeia piscesae TaxID=27915 RepID=A0AAD9NUC7_RIDPI|nr:hypothetical protein NP493_476g04051 [Ridgeia piscesae]